MVRPAQPQQLYRIAMPALDAIRQEIRANYLPDEAAAVKRLAALANLSKDDRKAISARAADLVRAVRGSTDPRLMEVFLSAYGLSTKEGVALMCLAEALLRVPDTETMDDLIKDKIAPHDWSSHSGGSSSIFVNASTWALMLTGRVLDEGEGSIERTLRSMVRRLGEPVIRTAVAAAMREMGEQFVLGRTITEAVKRGRSMIQKGYLYSFDMLGEAARTEPPTPLRYFTAPMPRRSRRSTNGTQRARHPLQSPAFRSSCPRCIRATRSRTGRDAACTMTERCCRCARWRQACAHGPHHRCRGSGPARPVARRHRGRAADPRSPAGTVSASSCRPTRSGRAR
jgi:hypothetical protein